MKINTHPVSQEELMAYLDGELDAERASATAAHLEHCRECQLLAADLQSVARQLLGWQVDGPSADLDTRVRAQLNGPQPRKRSFSFTGSRLIWGGACAAIVVLALVTSVISTRNDAMRMDSREVRPLPDVESLARPRAEAFDVIGRTAGEPGQPAPLGAPQVSTPQGTGPLVVHKAELTLTTREFDKTRDELDRVLAIHQGYIADLSAISPPDSGRSLTGTLKVPAAQLNRTMAALKELGRVDRESRSSEEVTRRYVDMNARLSNARNTEQRLTQLLRDRTGKLSDVLAVEEQIAHVRGEIEVMQAEQQVLSHQIEFATIELTLSEEYKQPLTVDHSSALTRLRNAAIDGFWNVAEGVMGTALFLLTYGPVLLVIAGVLFFPARYFWRIWKPS